MTTPYNPMNLLDSLQTVRKFRRTETTNKIRKEINDLEKRISWIEKFLKDIPKEEPLVPEGFFPLHHYFDLRPEMSETQVRKILDEGVKSGTVECGRWRSPKTKLFCKWYRAKLTETNLA